MTDIIERAEAWLIYANQSFAQGLVYDLVTALKAERAQRYNASTLSEDVIAHVLADIDQVSNEDQWPLRERLEIIQRICDGSEYTHD